MTPRKKTVLLTGFGPFPGVPVNVSSTYVEGLAAAAHRARVDANIVSTLLPTEWREAPRQLDELYFQHKPDIALHFGVSHQARAFTIECCARNCTGRPDAAGDQPVMPLLVPDGPQERNVALPTGRILARLRDYAVPAVISRDAGTYLCNAILYHSLELMETIGIHGKCGFIHLPTQLPKHSPHAPRHLTHNEAIAGGLLAITLLLGRELPKTDTQRRHLASA